MVSEKKEAKQEKKQIEKNKLCPTVSINGDFLLLNYPGKKEGAVEIINTNAVWEVRRQDSVGDKIGVVVTHGHDLPNPTRIEAKCESLSDRDHIIKQVMLRKDRHNVLSYNDVLKSSYDQMSLNSEISQSHIASSFRCNFSSKNRQQRYLKQYGPDISTFLASEHHFSDWKNLSEKFFPRSDIRQLFDSIKDKEETISISKMTKWLNEHQRDPRLNEILFPLYTETGESKYSVPNIISTMMKNDLSLEWDRAKGIPFIGFKLFLENEVAVPEETWKLDMDTLNEPMSHYFISSSHNTYLTGRQFGGESTVEVYRQVLLSGCRCIELDCWDGKRNQYADEPIITHGNALCTEILFKHAIEAIAETAFVTSEYPVVLSFENHCSKRNQKKMAEYCKEIFGEMLLCDALPDSPLGQSIPLPSPNQLKNRIIIKNKRLHLEDEKRLLAALQEGEKEEGEKEIYEDDNIETYRTQIDDVTPKGDSNVIVTDSNEGSETETVPETDSQGDTAALPKELEDKLVKEYKYTGSTTRVHPILSVLINYCQSIRFPGWKASHEKDICYKMSSFSETVGHGHLNSSSIEMVQYNKRQFSRIYPKGQRLDSSNYNPIIFWSAGCQLVALNYQTPDLFMQINQGKFLPNGKCGYILKPWYLREQHARAFDPFTENLIDQVTAASYKVQVISGQWLGTTNNVYVEVEIYGLPSDTIRKEFKTKQAKGPNPVWGVNSETFTFRKVIAPQMALLRLAVFEENSNKAIGQRSFPIEDLRAGYRHIPLLSTTSLPLRMAQLFVKVEMITFVYDEHLQFMEILQNPTKHLSRTEQRRLKLIAIGVEGDDIIDQIVEDDEKVDKMPKKTPKNDLAIKMSGIDRKDPKKSFAELGFKNIDPDTWASNKLKQLQNEHLKKFKNLKKRQNGEISKEEKRNKGRIEKLEGILNTGNTSCFGERNQSPGEAQTRLNEFLESRTKMKQIMEKNHAKKQADVLKKFEADRMKVIKNKIERKHAEDQKHIITKHQDQRNNMLKDQAAKNLDDKRKIQSENRDQRKKELDRMQREKTAQNGTIFARQQKAIEEQHDEESKLLTELHMRDNSIMNEILERERKSFESLCGISDS